MYTTAADLAEALVLNDLDAMSFWATSDRAKCLADCAAGSPDACACEWLLRDICEQFGVSEALADQAFKLYPAACQRLAAEELADDADDAE
jgi:hypothetical protein